MAGQSMQKAAAAAGINEKTVSTELRRRGIEPRSRRIDPPTDAIARYLGGESELALASSCGVSRTTVRRWLKEAAIPIRGRSEAGVNRASHMTAEQRSQQAAAAHAAVRGVPMSASSKRRRAETMERLGRYGSDSEQSVAEFVEARGWKAIPQKAVGIYNVDLAVETVAVEVLGGEWHASKPGHSKRTKDILDAGWHIAFIWDTPNFPLEVERAGDRLITFLERTRRSPAGSREYWVIRGDGQLVTAGTTENDSFAFIPAARGSKRGAR